MERLSGQPWSPDDRRYSWWFGSVVRVDLSVVLNPGDTVLIPEPTFSQYADITRLLGGEPIFVTQQEDFHLDLDALRSAAAAAQSPKIRRNLQPEQPDRRDLQPRRT